MAVFVVDKHKRPLMPCSEKRARQLLTAGRARIHRLVPFVIRLVDRKVDTCQLQPVVLAIDPGSKTTGLALCRVEPTDAGPVRHLLLQAELTHRGQAVSLALTSRASLRCTRRSRHLRYRAPRFDNRTQPAGWLPPSLRSRIDNVTSNVTSWVARCRRYSPVTDKDAQWIEVFLAKQPARLARILARCKAPLRDAAAVNATRNAILVALLRTGLPVETGSGGRTKYNRTQLQLPKTHALDAACVGDVVNVEHTDTPVLAIKATGRGSYQRTRVDKFGFPCGYLMRQKAVHGFQTGDLVSATVPSGKRTGTYQGRVAVRARGTFNIFYRPLHTKFLTRPPVD